MTTTATQQKLSKTNKKIPPDYKKVNRKRRQRGYALEYDIVQAFNQHHSKEWVARRLGGSSTGLPDIVATNNEKSVLYAIECKSGESNILYIPRDQIERCADITDKFLTVYQSRYMVLAFKFKANKKKGRKLQYRIIPMKTVNIFSTLKGVSYNIVKDQLSIHYTCRPATISVDIIKLGSIDQFLNWK